MVTVWSVLLFCGRFRVHYSWNHQGSLNWSVIFDVPSNVTVHARHAAGFRNTIVFSDWMRRIFNGCTKSRLVYQNHLINLIKLHFTHVLLLSSLLQHYLKIHRHKYDLNDSSYRILGGFHINSSYVGFYISGSAHYSNRSTAGLSRIKIQVGKYHGQSVPIV